MAFQVIVAELSSMLEAAKFVGRTLVIETLSIVAKFEEGRWVTGSIPVTSVAPVIKARRAFVGKATCKVSDVIPLVTS